MKKVFSFVLALCFMLVVAPVGAVAVTTEKGTTGECTWELDGTVLTISGKGKMDNYDYSRPSRPWDNKITEVRIEDGVTSIGDAAFYYCYCLRSVVIPDSVTRIGTRAFTNTPFFNNTDNWKDGVLYVDDHLIKSQITTEGVYTVKAGTKVIADSAFYGCENLSDVILPDSTTNIGEYTFSNCKNLNSITIPDSVTSIGKFAFSNCKSLSNITISNNLTDIPIGTFSNTAYSSDEKNWEEDVLYLGSYLIEVKDTLAGAYSIKDGTKVIADMAFCRGCDNLQSITIPDSVTSIGAFAFSGCKNLGEIVLPDTITSIGSSTFSFTAYTNDEKNWEGDVLYLGSYLIDVRDTISGAYTVKTDTKVIADHAFSSCKNLSSITIPNSVINTGKGNDVITMHTSDYASNAGNYSHLILLIVLAGLAVGAAVFFIIRVQVKIL